MERPPAGGGGTGCGNGPFGCGTVFALAADGTETVLHAFTGGCDGAFPFAGLVADRAGNYYGTTNGGGVCNNNDGFGTIFKIAPDGSESVLYAFKNGDDGTYPSWNLVIDKKGNLYGPSEGGGQNQCCGVVFKVSPKGKLTVLHTFQGGSDGAGPSALIMDKAGNFYGAAGGGGGSGCGGTGCGTVFELTPGGTETTLYAFQGGNDGERPIGGVVQDSAGNFYGMTELGGAYGYGAVFKVTPAGAETVLYSFQPKMGGYGPEAGLTLDKAGNLYGTTSSGGSGHCQNDGCGVVFKLAPDGTETVLYAFANRGGRYPAAGLLMGKNDTLYGTTTAGGRDNDGVVFKVTTQ